MVHIDLDDELAKDAHHIMLIGDFSDTTIQQANKKFDSAGRNGFVAFLGILTVIAHY